MKKTFRPARFAAAFALGFLLTLSSGIAGAAAENLTTVQTQHFIDAMSEISTLSEDMRKSGHDKEIEKEIQAQAGDGTFSPLMKGMPIMHEKFPADYQALTGIVTKHGFSSPEDWASVGDRVMLSYMSIKNDANPQMAAVVNQMTPEQMKAMPPEAQAQFQQARLMIKAASAVPAADKDTVRPFVTAIEDDMRKTAETLKQGNGQAAAPH